MLSTDPRTKSLAILIAAAILLVLLVALANSQRPSTVVDAPGTRIESTDGKTRIEAPGVRIEVPSGKD